MKRRCRLLWKILKTVHLNKFVYILIFMIFVFSYLFKIFEPSINTYFDGVWYCFNLITSIGFGDVFAVTAIGRILSVILGIYSLIVFALIPGILVSYYMEFMKINANETASDFLDKLERLPELSKEELKIISDNVKKRRYKL